MFAALKHNHPRLVLCTALGILILAAYWELTTMRGLVITDDIGTSDITNAHLPYFAFIGEAIKSGQLPLWIPYIYGGFPFFAGAAGVWYPLNLLLFGLLPLLPALNILLLATLTIAASGTFLYAREIGAGDAGGFMAGVAFAFSGFMVSHLKHVTMIESVCWFPLGLYIIEKSINQVVPPRARGGERSLLWLALVFAMQNLSAFTQVAYYSAILYVVYFVFRLARRQRDLWGKRGGTRRVAPAGGKMIFLLRTPLTWWFAGTLLIGVCASGIHLIPTYELVTWSHRAGGVSFDYASDYAYDMRDILTFIYPPSNGLIGDATYRGHGLFWEDYGYVGLLTIVAAVYALVGWKKDWYVRFLAVTIVAAYLLVIGNNTPVFGIAYTIVPGMKYFRFPTRFLFVVDFGLSVLGALGFARFGSRVYGKRGAENGIPRGVMEGGLLALLVGDLLFFQMPQNPIIDARIWFAPPANARLLSEDHGVFRIFSPGASEAHTAAFTKAGGWQRGLDPYVEQREYIQINSNVLYGLSTPDGYIPLSPDYVVDIWGDMDRPGKIKKTASFQRGQFHATPSFGKAMDTFNVKYLILPWRVEGINLVLLKEAAHLFIYRNPTVLPRVRIASVVRRAATPEKAQAILFGEEFDPSKEVILEDLAAAGMSRDTTASLATVESYGLHEVRIRVNAGQPGYLVCADTYYPGWRALVDGKEVPILRANVCQRAIAVPAGEHAVRFVFEPLSFTIGWMCTVVSLAALSIMGFVKRKGGG